MNTLIAVAIAPFGVGDELAPEVAEGDSRIWLAQSYLFHVHRN